MGTQSGERKIRLVLLDDHGLFRASLARFLAAESGIEVTRECGTPREALEILCGSKGPDAELVLLDFDLGGGETAHELIKAARQAGYKGHFLIVAGTVDVRKAALALKYGASGIFLKSDDPTHLLEAIRLIANGGIWVDAKIIRPLVDRFIERYPQLEGRGSDGLGPQERSVLLGVVEGLTNRRIGAALGLSESAVKATIQRLFAKACVRTRTELVRAAIEGNLEGGGGRYR